MEFSVNSSPRGEAGTPPDPPSSIAQPAVTPPCGPKLSASPMDNATPTLHSSSVASLLSSEKGRSSPEPNCSICLGKLENKSFTNGCLHQFCFTCLLQWSKIKAECPLCKQAFKSIIHNVRSMQEYDEYHVTVPEPFPPLNYQQIPYHDFLSTIQLQALQGRHPIAIPFRYSTTTMSTRRIDSRLYTRVENSWVLPPQRTSDRSRSRPRWRTSRRIANAEFRSSVYTRDLWAVPPEDLMDRVRDCSPAFYRLNPAQVHRLVPWLNRELDILLSGNTAPFVLDLIIRSVTQYEISSPEFRQLLRMHLGHRVDHFMHEFRSFASSHFDLVGYDQAVTYGPNPTPPATHSPIDLANEESSSSDSDVLIVPSDEPTAGPSGVNSGGRRQRPAIVAEPPPNDADEDSDDCLIVQCVKPRHERTPEIIELSSEDEHLDVGVNQAAESLDGFPGLTDFDLDSEELHEATLLLDDFQSTSLESNSNSSNSEYLPSKYLGKRKTAKKEADVKKKESPKSSAPKKTESKRGKSPCKKCAKRKSLLCAKKSSVCEKGKGKRSKCETCDKAATQSGVEERARRSRTNSSTLSKRPRRDAESSDSSDRGSTSLMKRLLETSHAKRPNNKRLLSSSSDEPVASTSSMPGPSRRKKTKQRSGGNAQANNGTTKPVWSSDDDEPIAKSSRQKKTKSYSSVDTSRKRRKKKARSSGGSELSTKTCKTAKERSGTHSRKRRTEASTNLSAVFSDSNDELDIETVSVAAHYRGREPSVDNAVVSPNSSSELRSHSFSRYDANLSSSDDGGPTGSNLDTGRTKAPPTTDARNGNTTILLSTTGSSSGDDRNRPSLNAHSRSCSDRSAFSEISQWPSPEPAMSATSASSNFVISSPNSSVDLSLEAKQSATLPTFPKYLDYCNASSSRDLKDVPNLIPYTVPSTSRSLSSQASAFNDLQRHYPETHPDGACSNSPATRSGVESTGERASRNHDDTWTILKPSASAVLSDDSTSDSLDLDENRPRLKSIVITRANSQSTSRQRSLTPDHVSSHSSRDSHTYKNYSKKIMTKKGEKSMRKKGRRVSSESSGDGRTYVKWHLECRKRHMESVQSSSS